MSQICNLELHRIITEVNENNYKNTKAPDLPGSKGKLKYENFSAKS